MRLSDAHRPAGPDPWPAVLLVALGVATWPVWRWYVLRISDGSDEPWGMLALLTLAALGWRRLPVLLSPRRDGPQDGRPPFEKQLAWPAAGLAVYTVTFPLAPPLVRALLAAGAFGALLFRGRGGAGLWGLLALSLPIVATLQFYLGYPLRVLAAEASSVALRGCGFAVVREGSLLHWAGETVMVDAPCSGIHMLWFGLYLAFLLAAFYRLNSARTLLCVTAALIVVVGANMARATALFFKEAHIVAWPEWTHAGVGLAVFSGAAWFIAALAQKLQTERCAS
ncbi:MAG: hypothetical protein QOE70_6063 [Chthoniobacter sp.]|nr:hypothetical protein [Chthoniobacter sp.]